MIFGRLCPLTRLPSRRTSFSPRRLFILSAPPVMGRTLTNALALAKVLPRRHNRFDLRRPLTSFIPIFKTFPKLFFFGLVIAGRHRDGAHTFPSISHCRGRAAQPGGGPADQRLYGNGGSKRRPYLCHPGDAAPANHLEEKRHHSEFPGLGGHQCE